MITLLPWVWARSLYCWPFVRRGRAGRLGRFSSGMDSQPPVEPDANYGGVTLSQLEEFLAVRKGRSARCSPLMQSANVSTLWSTELIWTYWNSFEGRQNALSLSQLNYCEHCRILIDEGVSVPYWFPKVSTSKCVVCLCWPWFGGGLSDARASKKQ